MEKEKELEDTKEGIEEFKQMAIDDIQMRDSSHKVPEKQLKKKEPNDVTEPIATSIGNEQHHRLTHQQSLTMLRDVSVTQLEEREQEIEERVHTIDSEINDFDDRVENFTGHVRRIYQDVDSQVENSKENSRVVAYIQKYDPDLYLNTLISANKEHADDLKRIERMKAQKPVKKPVRRRNKPQKDKEDKEGFSPDL